MSSHLLNTFGDSTTSLGSLFQYLATVLVGKVSRSEFNMQRKVVSTQKSIAERETSTRSTHVAIRVLQIVTKELWDMRLGEEAAVL